MFGAGSRRCVTFSEYVAIRWTGSTSGTFYTACYTSWGQVGDVLQLNNNVIVKTNSYGSETVIDGIAKCSNCQAFLSAMGNNNYLAVSLNAYVKVKRFVIAINRAEYFRTVFVYVGNSSDYNNGGVMVCSIGSSNMDYKVFDLEIDVPVTGSHFIIHSGTANDALEICELQVIGL